MIDHHYHPRLQEVIRKMLHDLDVDVIYFGEYMQFVNIKEDNSMPTFYVRALRNGFQFGYNKEFLETLTDEELLAVVIHEILHILWRHLMRTKNGHFDASMANIVQDMIINSNIKDHMDGKKIKLPGKCFFVPDEYKNERVFEIMYEWMHDQKTKYEKQKQNCKCGRYGEKQEGNGKGEKDKDNNSNNGEKQEGEGKGEKKHCDCEGGVSPEMQDLFDRMPADGQTIDVHLPDDVPQEMRDEMVKDIIEGLKARGVKSGNAEKIIHNLTKKKKDYLREIKRIVSHIMGGKKRCRSIKRFHRREIEGMKGSVRHSVDLNVILDTSGSMASEFEKTLSYIFQKNISCTLVQIDTEVKAVEKIKDMKELRKLRIKGLGGTTLQPALDYIKNEKKIRHLPVVVLTDGCCDRLNFEGLNKSLILSTQQEVNFVGNNVKCVIIEKE